MKTSGNKILVTGAGGFIGSALAKRLVSLGHEVVAMVSDLDKDITEELYDAGCLVREGSVTVPDDIRGLLSLYEIDTVYHLAAYSIVRLSARDPVSTYQVNVMGTVNVLEACRSVGNIKKIVVASSDKAYGDHDVLPYTEEHPLQPLNTYDVSKACADMIARSYAHNYGLPIVVTRCSNVYGPGDRNFSRLVPNTIRRILSGDDPMLYEDVSEMVREFIYIDDVVDAYVTLGFSGKETDGRAYNIGGTKPSKVSDVVDEIIVLCDAHEAETKIVKREATFKEIQAQWIDAHRLLNDTGWTWKTSLTDGLRKTIAWMETQI